MSSFISAFFSFNNSMILGFASDILIPAICENSSVNRPPVVHRAINIQDHILAQPDSHHGPCPGAICTIPVPASRVTCLPNRTCDLRSRKGCSTSNSWISACDNLLLEVTLRPIFSKNSSSKPEAMMKLLEVVPIFTR